MSAIDTNNETAPVAPGTISESTDPGDQNEGEEFADIVANSPEERKDEQAVEASAPGAGESATEDVIVEVRSNPAVVAAPLTSDATDGSASQPPAKRGPGRPPKVDFNTIVDLALDKILAHKMNRSLFGATSEGEIDALASSLSEVGQLVPVVVTPDLKKIGCYTLLSGHKRVEAMRKLGRKEARCQIVEVNDDDDGILRLLEFNRHHVPNREQTIRMYMVYFSLETKRARARQVAGATKKGASKEVETLAQAEAAGKARDIAAAKVKVHVTGVSAEKGRKVIEAADNLRKTDAETADELVKILNEKGYEPALNRLKALEEKKTPGADGNPARSNQPPATTKKTPPASDVSNGVTTAQEPLNGSPENDSGDKKIVAPDAGAGEHGGTDATGEDKESRQIEYATAFIQSVENLQKINTSELSPDLKRNLVLADRRETEWFANHGKMLHGPGAIAKS